MLNHKCIVKIIDILDHNDSQIRKEAIYIFCNSTTSSSYILNLEVSKSGLIDKILNLLEIKDVEILVLTLNTLENVLRASKEFKYVNNQLNEPCFDRLVELGVQEKIENLQNHTNGYINEKVTGLLNCFFYETPDIGSAETITKFEF